MRQPIQIVKIIGLLLFLLIFLMSITMNAQGADSISLLEIKKEESSSSTRMTFKFSSLPEFSMKPSGQRVELLLNNVEVSQELNSLPEDERVVKILLTEKKETLMVSVLLRRHPAQVFIEADEKLFQLIMNMNWDADEIVRPSVAFQISDMPPRKAGRRAAEFQQKSPWKDRWDAFYRDYRTYWKLDLPVTLTLPQLPSLVNDEESPLWPLQNHSNNNMFLSLIQTATELTGLDQQQRNQRDVLLAEAQLRTGAIAAGIARLDSLRWKEVEEHDRVEYLTAYGQALEEQPLVAQLTLQQLLSQLEEDHPLEPLVHLLFAETALASGQDRLAIDHLQSPDLNWPDPLLVPLELRIADAKAGLGDLDDALDVYRDLLEEPGLFEYYRFSHNRAAFTAFKNREYRFSSELYRNLVEPLKEEQGDDLLLFAAGASAYEAGDMGWGMIGLQRATLDRPETEGGDRGELRLIDRNVIDGGELELAQAVNQYEKLGVRSPFRPVREESRFKHALTLYLLGEHQKSLTELMRFRREFGNSELIREVDLLILQQLPTVVHQLIQDKNDLKAVVLAEQNRKLLLRSGFDKDFLYDLSTAFDRLGLYERAGRVLLYLFDRSSGTDMQQFVYLPLAQSFLKRKEYKKAGQYATRYLEKFPQGEESGAVFGILLDALKHEDRDDELLAWLSRDDRPSSPALEIRAAHIYWKLGQLESVVKSLERVYGVGDSLEVKEMALLAESYYQLKKNSAAEKIYRQLDEDPKFGVQARYRTAQILLLKGERKTALKLLQKVVETDGDSSWGKLAQDLLIEEQR